MFALLQKVRGLAKQQFGTLPTPGGLCRLRDTVTGGGRWDFVVGAQAPAGTRARQIVLGLLSHCVPWRVGEIYQGAFTQHACRIFFADKLLRELGFAGEAERCRERADRWLAEMDKHQRTFDLARHYPWTEEQAPRALAVLREFEEEHGSEALRRVCQVVPEKDRYKHLPGSYAWPIDRSIYYLSLAAETDLFSWFAERGATVHPLPIVKLGSDGAEKQMRACVGAAMRDGSLDLSSRMDAAADLAVMGDRSAWGTGDWRRLCLGLKLTREADRRARRVLGPLWAESVPPAVRAVAGVALADLGDASVGPELVRLAREFEPRFQLAAWHALSKAGSPCADDLAPTRVGDASGRCAGRFDTRVDGCLIMHGMVEGYRTNNILSQPALHWFTREAAITVHEVWWVHTSPIWRRRGLARATMDQTMNHPFARQCACSLLDTGTRNVAHPMYRNFGFTDTLVGERWVCDLAASRAAQAGPLGVTLRSLRQGDTEAVRAWCAETAQNSMRPLGPGGEGRAGQLAYVAERDGKHLGLVLADYSGGDEAHMRQLVLGKDDARERIADALLGLVHRDVHDLGAKRVVWYNPHEHEPVREALNRAGYVMRRTGGVDLMQIRDLVQFFDEISLALEARLRGSEFKAWRGRIDLVGDRLKARLRLTAGTVTALRSQGGCADIVMSTDDDTVTRVALGRETPFEAYLQTRLTIKPRVSQAITKLLEVLFPHVGL